MNTPNVILAAKAVNLYSENSIWFVYFSNDSNERFYCKSAYKAMRLMFLLKKRSGLNISDNCLSRLSHEIALGKAAAAATEQKAVADTVEMPKKRRGRKPKAEKMA